MSDKKKKEIKEEEVDSAEEAAAPAAEEAVKEEAAVPPASDEADAVAPEEPAPATPPVAAAAPVAAPAVAQQAAPMQPAPYSGALGTPAVVAPMKKTPEQEANEMLLHNLAFSQDLKNGAIHPKTYHDLYADKGILGKMGTMFGLLLAGAGSGITGQPNALLGMMDKEIERDFEAQKASKANELNWSTLALAHQRQMPEVQFQQFRNEKAGIPNAGLDATNNIMSSAAGINNARAGGVQAMQDYINKLPPGPQKDGAQNMLDTQVAPFFMNQAAITNLNAAKKKNLVQSMNPAPKGNPPPAGVAKSGVKYDSVNHDKMQAMIQKGQDNKYFGLPNDSSAIPDEYVPAIMKESNDLTVNRNNLADADDSFNNLAKLPRAGQAPAIGAVSNAGQFLAGAAGLLGAGPVGGAVAGALGHLVAGKAGESARDYFERNRNIQVEALKSRLGGNMSEDDKRKLAESLLPSWTDSPQSMAEAHRKMLQHFESNAAETAPNLARFGLKYPMPKYEFKVKKPSKEEKQAISTPMPPINLSK